MILRLRQRTIFLILLFLYFCGMNAHKLGYGFDAFFCRATFVALIGFEVVSNKKVLFTRTLVWYLSFVGLYFASIIWAERLDDVFAREVMFNFIQILGIMVVVGNNCRKKEDVQDVLFVLLCSLIYMSAMLIIRTPLSVWGSERVGSVLAMNSNDVGLRMAVAFGLTLYFRKQYGWLTPLLVVFTAIAFLSGSRKAFIMIILEVILYYLGKDQGWRMLRNVGVLIIICGALIYAVMNIPILYNVLGSRLERAIESILGIERYNQYGNLLRDYSGEERAFFRELAMQYFARSPVLGIGANGFATQLSLTTRYSAVYSHCNFVELLSNHGLVGFCAYYGYPVWLIVKGIKSYMKSKDLLLMVTIMLNVVFLAVDYYYVSYYAVFTLCVFTSNAQYISLCANGRREEAWKLPYRRTE